MVERESEKLCVVGSNPTAAIWYIKNRNGPERQGYLCKDNCPVAENCLFHGLGVWLNGRAVHLFLLALAFRPGPLAEGYRL